MLSEDLCVTQIGTISAENQKNTEELQSDSAPLVISRQFLEYKPINKS